MNASVMHDRGSVFWSWRGISRFTALLTELGIGQVVAEHKEHNSKVGVFNVICERAVRPVPILRPG